ncbi:hypothetical protein ACEYYB_00015 [Paracoccus sp. p4-l81]|uniref:hypothetical protein n=1 Tax=unclassified Paracoccus (in: a-proteobacteria) TaxID=2688777 RepID=UPI0035B9231C
MKTILLPLILLLAACASPAPQFFGALRHDLTVGGIGFTVFEKDDRVEVIRHGYLPRAARDRVPGLMRQAVEQATGCRLRGDLVTKLPGDTGEARGRIDC